MQPIFCSNFDSPEFGLEIYIVLMPTLKLCPSGVELQTLSGSTFWLSIETFHKNVKSKVLFWLCTPWHSLWELSLLEASSVINLTKIPFLTSCYHPHLLGYRPSLKYYPKTTACSLLTTLISSYAKDSKNFAFNFIVWVPEAHHEVISKLQTKGANRKFFLYALNRNWGY